MASSAATVIAYLGAFAGLVAGGVALFNARKSVQWKRAELASSYLKELNSNPELVFACRCLDWQGGKMVIPDQLRPLIGDDAKIIVHEYNVLTKSMKPSLFVTEMDSEPRLQLYRTALDSLLSWLSLVDNALERKLFSASDIPDAGYWVRRIKRLGWMDEFIDRFGYKDSTARLRLAFPSSDAVRGGLGGTGIALGTGGGS